MNDAARYSGPAQLLGADQLTAGMYVRVLGDQLIGRTERIGPEQTPEHDDRIRFTRLGANLDGLSVKRHTRRGEKNPFSRNY